MTSKNTIRYLKAKRAWYKDSQYDEPKWITFCDWCLRMKWDIKIYDSKSTVSKYIYINKEGFKEIKVRFSNHKANQFKESVKDSDFYVGVGHLGVCTTEQVFGLIQRLLKGETNDRN